MPCTRKKAFIIRATGDTSTTTDFKRRIDVNRKTYVTFIDLGKSFDMVDWRLLFQKLELNGKIGG